MYMNLTHTFFFLNSKLIFLILSQLCTRCTCRFWCTESITILNQLLCNLNGFHIGSAITKAKPLQNPIITFLIPCFQIYYLSRFLKTFSCLGLLKVGDLYILILPEHSPLYSNLLPKMLFFAFIAIIIETRWMSSGKRFKDKRFFHESKKIENRKIIKFA